MQPNNKQDDGKHTSLLEKSLGGITLNADSERHYNSDTDFSAKEPNDDANHGTTLGKNNDNLDRGQKNALYEESEKRRMADNPDRKEDTPESP